MTDQRPLRTLIADDEPLARRLLKSYLEQIPEVELVGEFSSGQQVVDNIGQLQPDLLILDIQMPGLTGFEVVKELQADLLPPVIFCTAFQRYALDAFDLHAVDYVLKPVRLDRLQRAVSRAVARAAETGFGEDNKSPVLGAIDEIARKVGGRGEDGPQGDEHLEQVSRRKLAIKDGDQIKLVETEDIDWVDAAGDYMCLHVRGETLIMRSTLKALMERLDPERFVRIHRSTIVNLQRIVRVGPLPKGEFMLDLDCEQQLKVSRNFRDSIKHFLSSG